MDLKGEERELNRHGTLNLKGSPQMVSLLFALVTS